MMCRLALLLAIPAFVAARQCGWHDIRQLGKLNLSGCDTLELDHDGSSNEARIGDEGAFELARALGESSGASVHKVSLTDQAIGVPGSAEIAETLKAHKVLTTLDLGSNPIGTAGTAILAEALQANHVITSLFFAPDGVGAAEAVVEALDCNSKFVVYSAELRDQEASACKKALGSFVQGAQAAINSAVQAQAQLEAQLEAQLQRKRSNPNQQQAHSLPPPPPSPSPPPPPMPSPSPHLPSSPSGAGAPCQDDHDQCAAWARAGECSSNAAFMHAECRKACNKCLDAPLAAKSPAQAATPAAQAAMQAAAPAAKPTAAATPMKVSPTQKAVPATPATPATPASPATPATPATPGGAVKLEEDELLKWIDTHQLSKSTHLPILHALGVKRVSGREGSLKPLTLLSYAELAAELQGVPLPCSPTCAADKAAVYQALMASKPK